MRRNVQWKTELELGKLNLWIFVKFQMVSHKEGISDAAMPMGHIRLCSCSES